MRRLAAIFLAMAFVALDLAAQVDSVRIRELDARLESYFALLEAEPARVKNAECDALIEAASDKDLRQRIASLMGDEAVAIHLIDRWFSNGEIPMGSEKELLDARLFAEFNRQSLIGMTAPEVTLQDPLGEPVTIPVILSGAKDLDGAEDPRLQILYFFDTDCAKCKLETAMLRSLLDDKGYPVDVVAVYVGREEEKWRFWRESTFPLRSGAARVIHLWDPEDSSGYQMKYGVTSTPRMFLIDPEGVIVGRGLDTRALERLLDMFLVRQEYVYGGKESRELFDKLFSVYGVEVTPSDVSEVASLLENHSLSRGDTLAFKRLEGDLLYYLASGRGEGFKEGTFSFINDYILSRGDIWNTPDDSLKVIGMASMMEGLLGKAPVGSVIPKTRIKGWNKFRRKGGYLFFSAAGCPVCAAEAVAADSLGVKYLKIDMTSLEGKSPRTAGALLDFFDLSSLPYIIQTGRRGVVKRRYLSFSEHLLFLGEKD